MKLTTFYRLEEHFPSYGWLRSEHGGGLELTATVLVRDFDDIPRARTLTNLVTVAPSDMYECA